MKDEKTPKINKVKNRLLYLSPTVQAGFEQESTRNDFFQDGGKSLGKGAFGEVWKVTHKITKKVYVIKVIKKKLIIENKLVEQMNREIEIMYKLNHPHIIRLVNHFEDDDCFYLILDFASKGQLYSILQKQRQKRFDEKTAAQYFREAVISVKYIHSFNPPIIHRDIKPENILIDEDNRVKLADFGWSNFANEQIRKTLCGTPEYLAPEMLAKSGHDCSVDIWSLGVLLYEFLCGYSPFKGRSQEEVYQNIRRFKIVFPDDFPPYAKDLVQRMLKKTPSERLKVDEILNHIWFQKTEKIYPDLVVNEMTDEEILKSRILNIPEETIQNQVDPIKQKVLRLSSLAKQKSNSTSDTDTPQQLNGGDQTALSESLQNVKKELENSNIELTKYKHDYLDLQSKHQKTENENKQLKTELMKLLKQLEETNQMKEELEKSKVLKKDRLDLLTELEEKNNQVSELNNQKRTIESELFEVKKERDNLSKKYEDLNRLYEITDSKNSQLKTQLENSLKENSSISSQYQNKIEILQAKVFDKLNPEESNQNVSTNNEKINSLIVESINDFKILFKSKMDSLHQILSEIKDDVEKSNYKFEKIINEKSNLFIDALHKVRGNFDNDLIQIKMKLDSTTKGNERQEWLKKQISELIPFKQKTAKNEATIEKLEKDINLLTMKLSDVQLIADTNKKICDDKNQLIAKNTEYCSNIEAKLSDVKDFVIRSCPDKLDELEKLLR